MAQIDCTRDPAETLIVKSDPNAAQSIAHYTLRREIGRGGMSSVYEAEDTRTGTNFALKLLTLPPSLTTDEKNNLIARFEREARIISRLSYPNIVDIHEVGEDNGRHFLAMEYLHGETLRERMTREILTPEESQKILSQIAGAVDAVHAAGIVHRDIKPTNIMLLPDGTAKLLDFGIARSSEETSITSTGILVGSPSYMAPEQIKGEAGTAATDLWAMGVLAYEMLSGHPPFTGQTVANVLYQITNESPARTPTLSVAVQKALRRALDKNPARRYPNAAALLSALEEAQPEIPSATPMIAARPHPRSAPRWLPAAALLVLFLLGFSWTLRQRHEAAAFVRVQTQNVHETQTSVKPKTQIPMAKTQVPTAKVTTHLSSPAVAAHPQALRAVSYKHTAALSKPRQLASAPIAQKTKPRLVRFHHTEAVHRQNIQKQEPGDTSISRLALPDSYDGDDPEADAQIRKLEWAQTQ